MKFTVQKKLAASVLKTSQKKVKFDATQLASIKEAITKADMRNLVKTGAVAKKKTSQQSRARANKILVQKRKGRRQGMASRKGKHSARLPTKNVWVTKIRAQRRFLQLLRDKNHVSNESYRKLYEKCHGGYFRNVRHIKLYAEENGYFEKSAKDAQETKSTKKSETTKPKKQKNTQ